MQEIKNVEFGLKYERLLKPLLENEFGSLKLTNLYHTFDYIGEKSKFIIELKSRRCCKMEYRDTMLPYVKIKEGYKYILEGYRVIFVFKFTDYISYFELTDSNIDQSYIKRHPQRIETYTYIPVDKLIDLYNYS